MTAKLFKHTDPAPLHYREYIRWNRSRFTYL